MTKTHFSKASFIDKKMEERMFENLKKKKPAIQRKYRLIILLMLDCGLRVTEVVRLMAEDIQFNDGKNGSVAVVSLKKRERSKNKIRVIPMTYRTLEAASEYWMKLKSKHKKEGAYIFPPGNNLSEEDNHIRRGAVNKMFNKLSGFNVNPHKLRHTYATELAVKGADVITIKELLGHESTRTSEIYLHAKREKMEQAVEAIEVVSFYDRIKRKFFPVRRDMHVIPVAKGLTQFHVGRKKELDYLHELLEKRVNTLLIGPQGIGKSHILDNLRLEKVLRIDEMKAIKKTLIGILLEFYENDKEAIMDALYEQKDVKRAIQIDSVKNLVELMMKVTERHEYTIIVDDATTITATGVSVLEKMKNHFHFVIAARRIKYSQMSFVTNFEKIELENLPRFETVKLISLATESFANRIENWEMYKNHIWRSANGNPLFTLEMIERFKKEGFVSEEMVSKVKHTASLKEWDMSLILLIGVSSLMILRYYGRESGGDKNAFMFIGGIFLVFALFARPLLSVGKRKYV